MAPKYSKLLRVAYDRYISLHGELTLEPCGPLLEYDFEFLRNRKWRPLGEILVDSELRELTNLINRWSLSLQSWQIWNRVLDDYDQELAWCIQYEFIESIAQECLIRPSSIRDTVTAVATNAFHQVRLASESSYKDYLEGDPKTPNKIPKLLKRAQKEKQLRKLCEPWSESEDLIKSIDKLNSSGYKLNTFDYRNRINHTIGPRLGVGDTKIVTRNVCQATELKERENGFFEEVPIPGKMSVAYVLGGTPPLDLEKARLENLNEFKAALACYSEYRSLLERVVSNIEILNGAVEQLTTVK